MVTSAASRVKHLRDIATWLFVPMHWALIVLSVLPIAGAYLYVDAFGKNIPLQDSAIRSVHIAVQTLNDELQWSDFLLSVGGHLSVPRYLLTVWLTETTRLSNEVEIRINLVIILLTYLIALSVLYRQNVRAMLIAAVPLSVLYFSVIQNTNLLIGYHGVWFEVNLFVLTTLACLYHFRERLVGVLLAAVMAITATITVGNGFLAWWMALVLIPLTFQGRRRWFITGVWLLLAASFTAAYLYQVISRSTGDSPLFLSQWLTRFQQGFAYIASPINPVGWWLPLIIGLVGSLLFINHIVFLIAHQRPLIDVTFWTLIAGFAYTTGVMVALTRAVWLPSASDPDGLFASYYTTVATNFWIGWVAITVLVWIEPAGHWRNLSLNISTTSAVVLAVIMIPNAITQFNNSFIERVRTATETCYRSYLYIQDGAYLRNENDCYMDREYVVNDLSYYELALMSEYDPQNILTPHYRPDMVVVVENDVMWGNYNIQKWLLAGVPSEQIIHLSPPERAGATITGIDLNLENGIAIDDQATLAARIREQATIWHVRRRNLDTRLTDIWNNLLDTGYVYSTTRYETREGIQFTLDRYDRVEIDIASPVQFGDSLQLKGWTPLAGRVQACSTVSVQSLWSTDALLDVGYSATLNFNQITGDSVWDFETVARVDQAVSITPTERWDVQTDYVDNRQLAIPCDLPPGEYELSIGVYNYQDGARLTPQGELSQREQETGLFTLEAIQVE